MKQNNNLLFETHTRKKKRPLFIIGIATVIVLIVFMIVVVCVDNNKKEPNSSSDLTLNLIHSSVVDGKQYNIWFDVNSQVEDSIITFDPSLGVVMLFNNETEETSLATSVHCNELSKYSFIWVYDYIDAKMMAHLDVTATNESTSKIATFYVQFNGDQIGFTDKDGYLANGGMLE